MGLLRPVEISGGCRQCGDKALHRLWTAELGHTLLCGKHMIQYEAVADNAAKTEELLVEWHHVAQ